MLVWVVVTVALLAAHPTRAIGLVSGNLLLLQLLSFCVVIPVHEIGHALVGRLVGLDVVAIILGHGRVVWTGRLAGISIELRDGPIIMGATLFDTSKSTWLRCRLFAAVLGGPLANLACALWIWRFLGPWPDVVKLAGGLAPLVWLCVGNWIVLVASLVPQRNPSGRWSDGAQLFWLVFRRRLDLRGLRLTAELHEWNRRRDAGDAVGAHALALAMRARHPDLPSLATLVGIALIDSGSLDDARAILLSVLEHPEEPSVHAMQQNNVAFIDFVIGADELRDEADALSAAAIASHPKAASVLGTRGSVLVWLGRADEGISLLEQSFAANEIARDRATNACALAMGYNALVDTNAATRWLEIARRLDPRCGLLDRATAELASADDLRLRAAS